MSSSTNTNAQQLEDNSKSSIASSSESQSKGEKGVKMVMGTVDDVMYMAEIIMKDVKDRESHKEKKPEEKLKYFQDKYADFGKTFPIVLKHIVTTENYYKDVFLKFVNLCQAKPTHSMEQFQDRQARYLTMVYRKEHPHCGAKEAAKVHGMYSEQLRKEEQHMKKVMESVQENREKRKNNYNEIKRKELIEMIKKYKDQIPDNIEVNLSSLNRDQMNTREEAIDMTAAPLPIQNELTSDDVKDLFPRNNAAKPDIVSDTPHPNTSDELDEEDDA